MQKRRINEEGFVEVYNPVVNTFIEEPVNELVTYLNLKGVTTSSSGWHSKFTKDFNGLDPCWCIICNGKVATEIKLEMVLQGCQVQERYPIERRTDYLLTEIYLLKIVESSLNISSVGIDLSKVSKYLAIE